MGAIRPVNLVSLLCCLVIVGAVVGGIVYAVNRGRRR